MPNVQVLRFGEIEWGVPLDARILSVVDGKSRTAKLLTEATDNGLMLYRNKAGMILLMPDGVSKENMKPVELQHFLAGYAAARRALTVPAPEPPDDDGSDGEPAQ